MYIAAEFAVTAPAAFAWLAAHTQSFASAAGATLITAAWQGAVIVCVLEIATRLMPRISAAHRFALWSGGFILSLSLSLLPLVHFSGNAANASASSSVVDSATPHPLFQLDSRWGFAIAALWLAASLLRMAALAMHSIRLWRLWKAAQPAQIKGSHSTPLSHLRRRRIGICTTKMLDRPSVIGFLSPRILIPDWLLSRLTPGELDQIVLHEAEHLRRADDWTNLIQKLCLVVFPLNPGLAWAEHRLCREREMACDEGVVRLTNAPRAYAACLASLAERRLERRAEALSLGAWHRRSELVDRVHRILLHNRAMGKTAAGALLATLGTILIAGSIEMARTPQLIAFVPKQNTQAMTPARQVQLDALLASENAEEKRNLLAPYSAVPAMVALPDEPSRTSSHVFKRKTARPASASRPAISGTPASAQQVAQTDQLGDRVIQSGPPPQQWLVVTEWRESLVSRIPQTISDFEQPGEPVQNLHAGNANTSASATPPTQSLSAPNEPVTPTHHFTVTQLILRVVPANPNSSSTQPPTTTVRDGWFVIQL